MNAWALGAAVWCGFITLDAIHKGLTGHMFVRSVGAAICVVAAFL